jgi:protein-S-isoprenylcysteine O-methyltransferase Ste14
VPSRLRIAGGYLAGLTVLALAEPAWPSWLVGLALATAGEGVRLWASGHIEKTVRLATGGPYAHTRNPLYVGSLLMAIGVALAAASVWAVAAVVLYFLAFYPSVMREEAGFLRQKFGLEFEEWARDVPVFLPRFTPGGPRRSRFEWARVTRNREWRTAAALPLAGLLLFARSRLPLP